MSRSKNLNIYNTDRAFNLNLITKQDEANFVKVTRLNEREIERDMDRLAKESKRYKKRDNKTYLLYRQRYANDTVQTKVFDHGGTIKYYAGDRCPIPVINHLSRVPDREIIYTCKKEYSIEEVNNVHLASMAANVSVDVPIVLPDINVYDYLFALYPLRFHVDKVKVSFPPLQEGEIKKRHRKYYTFYNGAYHLKDRYKYECFKHLQEPLSTWKMNLWIICDSKVDLKKIEDRVVKDHKRFKRTDIASKGGSN